MSEYTLSAHNLSCNRDDRDLFVDLNFNIESGQVVQVAGPNGSGKTTLLRILCGLMSEYEGEIRWRGQPVRQSWEQYRSNLTYIGHAAGIKATLTAEENLSWLLDIHGNATFQGQLNLGRQDRSASNATATQSEAAAIADALAKVGLKGFEDVQTHQLSAGQKRRVGLARLYLEQTPLWILDEPFTAIDHAGVKALEQLLLAHAERGGIVILTTHHPIAIESERFQRIQLGGNKPSADESSANKSSATNPTTAQSDS